MHLRVAVGIDVGTTNVKVVFVDEAGTVQATAERPVGTDVDRDAGHADADAESQWQAVAAAVRSCAVAAPEAAAAVTAIGVDSQYSSIVPVDDRGLPVAPMRLWSDRRGTAHSRAILAADGAMETFLDRHGLPPMGNGLSLGHVLSFQHDSPDVHDRTAAYLEPMDYVNARLTGRAVANQATQFMSQLVDNRTLGATSYDEDLVALAGVDGSRLPPLVALDEIVGEIRPDVATALGLPRRVQVAAGINDTQASSVAAGVGRADRPGRAGVSIGTTAVLVDAVADKRADLDHELLTCPGAFADQYLLFAENGIAGAAIAHVVETLVDTGGFATLDEVLAAVPAGAGGALFLPWLAGSMAPAGDARMRGGFINVGLDTDRATLVRAAIEGVAHNLAWLVPLAVALTERPIDEIVLVGGAARSSGVAQVLADVTDRTIAVAADPAFAIARATGLLALYRIGALSRDELAEVAAPPAAPAGSGSAGAGVGGSGVGGARVGGSGVTVARPTPANRAVYDRHQTQFEAAFAALRPIVRALAAP